MFPSTKKQKILNMGTLFKKALDEIHGQTHPIFLTKFETLYSRETHITI